MKKNGRLRVFPDETEGGFLDSLTGSDNSRFNIFVQFVTLENIPVTGYLPIFERTFSDNTNKLDLHVSSIEETVTFKLLSCSESRTLEELYKPAVDSVAEDELVTIGTK